MAVSTPVVFTDHTQPRNPPSVSAEELHGILVKTYRLRNRLRHEFLKALLCLSEQGLYLKLGYSSIFQYAEKYFGYQRSETYEALRVAKALRELPRLAGAFDRGELCWSKLKEITRVAKESSEERWLEFASSRPVRQVQAEVQEAVRKDRDAPRKDGDSMPRFAQRLSFEFTPEEHDILGKALEKVASEMSESLGGERIEPQAALLFMAQRWLETEPEDTLGVPGKRREREEPLYTVLYHYCKGCRTATLPTAHGAVEIPPETVERVEGDARKVTIEPQDEVNCECRCGKPTASSGKRARPNTPALTRRVFLRDGQMCANPFCRRRCAHAHHIALRSQGGATELWNEVSVCAICHSLLHLGYLEVEGDPVHGLRWRTRADRLRVDLKEDMKFLASLGVLAPSTGSPAESGRPDTVSKSASENPWLLAAMKKLGYAGRDAFLRLGRAEEKLLKALQHPPTEEEVLQQAVSGRN